MTMTMTTDRERRALARELVEEIERAVRRAGGPWTGRGLDPVAVRVAARVLRQREVTIGS